MPLYCQSRQVLIFYNADKDVKYLVIDSGCLIILDVILQSIWTSSRGAQKELDEARLRFAAAEVLVLEFLTSDINEGL